MLLLFCVFFPLPSSSAYSFILFIGSMVSFDQLGRLLMQSSVSPSTLRTYNIGWESWCNFAKLFQFDPFLRHFPPQELIVSSHVSTAVTFIAHCFFVRRLAPATITTYLAGVGFYFRLAGLDTSFLNSASVDMAKSGASLLARRETTTGQSSTLPCSLDMILAYQRSVPVGYERYQAIVTGLLLGFSMLLRVSEYVALPNSNHHFRSQDVVFSYIDGSTRASHSVLADDWPQITKVTFLVRSAKNDIHGHGNKMIFARRSLDSKNAVCLCKVAFDWAVRAQLLQGDAFLSYRQQWLVTYSDINHAVKSAATLAGLPQARFSSHSLRYGGASALAAAGMSHHGIQLYGRWHSTAFLQYLKMSEAVFNRTLDVILTSSSFSVTDIRDMFPV